MSEPTPDRDLASLAGALKQLEPQPALLNRDALMFRAGRASAPRPWLWSSLSAVVASAATLLVVVLMPRSAPVERIVYLPAPPPPALAPEKPVPEMVTAPPRARYLQLQERLLRDGLDGLPVSPPPAPPSKFSPDSLLGLPPAVPDRSSPFPRTAARDWGDPS